MKKKLSNQSLRHIFKSRSLLFLVLFFYLSCSKDDGYDDNTYTITQAQKQTLTGYTINVTAQNSQDYSLSGNDANGSVSGNDPEITISVGETINFIVRATGHPFYFENRSNIRLWGSSFGCHRTGHHKWNCDLDPN